MTIRAATLSDAPAIAAVHVASWRGAYRGHVSDEKLDDLDPARLAVGWRNHLEDDASSTLVLEVDGAIIGFCRVIAEKKPAGTGEIAALYLHPDAWGKGLGRELCARALALLAARGCTEATLWALEGNARAERFYASIGFRADGAIEIHPRLNLPIVRYRITLDPDPGPPARDER